MPLEDGNAPETTASQRETTAIQDVVNYVADHGFVRPDESPKEGEDAQTEDLGEPLLMKGERNAPSELLTLTARGEQKKEAKAPKADMRIQGEFSPQLPPEVQAQNAAIARKELNFQEAQSFSRLQEGRALLQTKAMAQEIAANDFNEMQRLNNEHYARWETENAKLRADIDAARQLRVNPHNWRQSIGRSGRVASVMSVAVSQLAAGAGSPNLVWNRVKSAIEQDISAQEMAMTQEWKGIKASQEQQQHEADMLGKYYGFKEQARAVGYAALEAQVGVIMQRAANENEYQTWQMIRDRAQAEANASAAAALAKNATLYLDAPTYSSYQALLKAKRWQQAQAMLQESYRAQYGDTRPINENVLAHDQEGGYHIFGPAPTGAPPPTGEVSQTPVEAPQAPVQTTPAPAASRVAKRRTAAPAPSSPQQQVVPEVTPQAAPERPLTPQAAPERPLTPQEAASELALGAGPFYQEQLTMSDEQKAEVAKTQKEEEVLRRQAAAVEIEKGVVQRMGAEVIQKGGYKFAQLEREGFTTPSIRGQGLNTFLEGRDIILDPDNPEISVFPSYADAREGLKYDTRSGERAKYERENPELYEQYIEIEHEGTAAKPRWVESTFIPSNWGKLKLRGGSRLRTDAEARDKLREEVNTDFTRAENIARQANAIANYGTGTVFGLSMGPDGLTWPGDPEALAAAQERQSGQIGLGIEAMKLLDPSGRLTDQDIIVGKEYVTAILQDPSIKGWDLFTRVWRRVTGKDPSKGDLQRSIKRTLQAMAVKLSDAVAKKHNGEFVLDYEQHKKFEQQARDTEKFLRSEAD